MDDTEGNDKALEGAFRNKTGLFFCVLTKTRRQANYNHMIIIIYNNKTCFFF